MTNYRVSIILHIYKGTLEEGYIRCLKVTCKFGILKLSTLEIFLTFFFLILECVMASLLTGGGSAKKFSNSSSYAPLIL